MFTDKRELLKMLGRVVKARLPVESTYCLVVSLSADDELHLISNMDEGSLGDGLREAADALDRQVAERN